MPYENVVDVDGESLRCWVCDGVAVPQLWTSMAWW
jgi:hypothetical protein